MRRHSGFAILLCICVPIFSQSSQTDESLLQKARSLYDAPYTRDLAAFDCNVEFDWKQHFTEMLGTIPQALFPAIDRLQTIHHRVNLNERQPTIVTIPKSTDFTGIAHGAELEQVLLGMITGGTSAWIPPSTNALLPSGTTKYHFENLNPGYKLTMTGEGVSGRLLLQDDLRITSGVMQAPDSIRFTTEFIPGPEGFRLSFVRTEPNAGNDSMGVVSFAFTYQTVDGHQLPAEITVLPSTTGKWHYRLNDCKVVKFVKVNVQSPKE
jgi:hypothetical protein